MSKQIVIAEQHRIAAVFAEDQIQELIVATGTHQVSDIYLGIVENVLPGIDAAFVNIGDSERNGFIHVSDLGPLRLKRSAGSITELLAPQQKVLVQVMKEPTGSKGPRLTGNISLPGRYLVLMPNGRGVNLSRRITNENERNRLRALAILIKPAGMGMVVRTEADGVPEEAIIEDLEMLQRQWENVLQEATSTRAPALLNRDDDFVQRVLRDVYSGDVNRIVVDSVPGLKRVKQHLTNWGGGKLPQGVLIDQHRDRGSILEYFRVNAAIREAMKPRVDLPSGGYIIIEKTEALTVIDVNSGSFTRSATARETVLWTNCEAATEIARQLRLRNIAGVIVVDFIDMESRRDQLQVLEHFNKALRADKAKPQIAQLTELGLVELTRKRQGKNIYELFGQPCHTCGGLGLTAQLPGEGVSAIDLAAVERLAATEPRDRSVEARRDFNRREPQPSYDAPRPNFDEFETESNEGDLELLHHPSYQERGRSRRRRRRPGEPFIKEAVTKETFAKESLPKEPFAKEPFTKEPTVAKATSWEEPSRYPGTVGSPVLAGARGNGSPVPTEEVPARDARPERGERPEREDRRSRNRRDRFPSEPPEVVHVEMTEEEQDVYALMGVSPLILSPQEVKNPKAALISVFLPGEAPPVPEVEAGLVDRDDEDEDDVAVSVGKFSASSTDSVDEIHEADTFSSRSGFAPSLSPSVEESSPFNQESEESAQENDGRIRRRRRRSSAVLEE
ncbi:Rne/Rng family ribonuclease [Alkalinema sp. FACHB-956]|uniref:Rne/Rng family ribonuclease n=1 Tax=Alkalinema sp. FACHB-956 TaxID=2692768 RepID=UPI0016869E1E|nr:Rne/Rng family ribonuclease [Alkalinema sp. FACHB-956]MBD2328990.1 Rne/Rng family ribonuclease [Alkalinema sp. FACHB-956]